MKVDSFVATRILFRSAEKDCFYSNEGGNGAESFVRRNWRCCLKDGGSATNEGKALQSAHFTYKADAPRTCQRAIRRASRASGNVCWINSLTQLKKTSKASIAGFLIVASYKSALIQSRKDRCLLRLTKQMHQGRAVNRRAIRLGRRASGNFCSINSLNLTSEDDQSKAEWKRFQ
ncbi:hypothetical protein CDAR_318051 [Caerostris darwini]|uniref:Uncharacterized protein n=1 Tax=Caerostris darwini TaxID=1538125 RepID=A0AAV4WTV3_9ARAC|nr:hypothetical protein CDAR_318051 [Caerostris darwini]